MYKGWRLTKHVENYRAREESAHVCIKRDECYELMRSAIQLRQCHSDEMRGDIQSGDLESGDSAIQTT